MKFNNALLCINCDEIFQNGGQAVYGVIKNTLCPSCGSSATISLAIWIMKKALKQGSAAQTASAPAEGN